MARKDEAWLREWQQRTGQAYTLPDGTKVTPGKAGPAATPAPKKRGESLSQLTQPSEIRAEYAPALGKKKKNKTEKRFENTFLWPAKLEGKLISYQFERVKLVLADGRTYLPDFFGKWQNGVYQFWEIKGGYIHEDAFVKFDCASTQFPEFAFQLCQWKGGEWRTLRKIRC